MNINLPEIDYDYWLGIWTKNQEKENSVYSNLNMKSFKSTYLDVKNAKECEEKIDEIINKIDDLNKQKQLVLTVVDLIYRWGGPSGRMFYARQEKNKSRRENLENKTMLYQLYCDGVELARKGKISSKFLFESIPGIGPSFATKHAAFWSRKSNNPLIVVDSKIAGALGFKSVFYLEQKIDYDSLLFEFNKQARIKIISADKTAQNLEKALFTFHSHFFLNENNGWLKNINEFENQKDFKIAIKIAEYLQF
jgi:hypothetical protein